MKTIILSLTLLSAIAGTAFADLPKFAGDNQAPYRSEETSSPSTTIIKHKLLKTQALAQPSQPQMLQGRYGLSDDPMEVRRWDEKNGG